MVSKTALEATRLLELTKSFELNWSRAEQRLVNRLLREKLRQTRSIKKSLKVTGVRVNQLVRDIRVRLKPLAKAIERGELDKENVRAWPISLLKLDKDRDDRRIEKSLLIRQITMVPQLLGPDSPLARPESRKGLGKGIFGAVEEKLKPYGIVEELAWNLPPPPDSRRALQEEIEQRIQKFNQR